MNLWRSLTGRPAGAAEAGFVRPGVVSPRGAWRFFFFGMRPPDWGPEEKLAGGPSGRLFGLQTLAREVGGRLHGYYAARASPARTNSPRSDNSNECGGPNGIRTRVYSPPRASCFTSRSWNMLTQQRAPGDSNSEGALRLALRPAALRACRSKIDPSL